MAVLTKKRIDEVTSVLDESFFTSAGYSISVSDKTGNLIIIRLQADERFFIQLDRKTQRSIRTVLADEEEPKNYLLITTSPGEMMAIEQQRVNTFQGFLERLSDWTNRVKDEVLFVDRFEGEFEKFRDEIDEELNKKFKDETVKFSENEIAQIRKQLDEIQERLSAIEAEKKLSESQIAEINSFIDDLNTAAEILPKRTWYRTAATKLYQIGNKFVNSKIGQQVISYSVKMLLEGQINLPQLPHH